jgi:transglutaminase-like putative cysteine protease
MRSTAASLAEQFKALAQNHELSTDLTDGTCHCSFGKSAIGLKSGIRRPVSQTISMLRRLFGSRTLRYNTKGWVKRIRSAAMDAFGNVCTRLVAPPGLIELSNEFLISESGLPDEINNHAEQWPVGDLPDEPRPYLLGSRYCDTQKVSDQAWAVFGAIASGWQRVQAICDYVHDRIEFGYHHARCDRAASEGHEERIGVRRDFASGHPRA